MTVSPSTYQLRQYDNETQERVKDNYRDARSLQTLQHVQIMLCKYGNLTRPMEIWESLDLLDDFIDLSDPDIELPNLIHLYQTAEGIRREGLPDWLQLTGFIHDLGKIIYSRGCDEDGTSLKKQWSIVGDTFVVGCALPDTLVFPEYNNLNPDFENTILNTRSGIYKEGCGLNNCHISFGHDEYLYQVLNQNQGVKLPREALYIIRYHSLYAWHKENSYQHLESDYDRAMKGWVKLFNRHDLYTKENIAYTPEQLQTLREYYSELIKKYLPATLKW